MIEGPGHVPMDKIKEQVGQGSGMVPEAPFYLRLAAVTGHRAGATTTSPARLGAAMIGCTARRCFCYVTPKEQPRLAESGKT